MIGNPSAVAEIAAWGTSWDRGGPPARRTLLLIGPPGVGKTSAAAALATDRGWALVEMNASEARNASAIDRIAGRASITRGLDGSGTVGLPSRTLVLLDEADCLSGGRTTEGARVLPQPVDLRAFLEGRYGSVGALNDAWGLSAPPKVRPFETWAAVPRTPGNAAWARLPSARRDLDEWREAGRPQDTGDRGGLGAIARLVRSTRQPLVLTVNDERPLFRYSPVFRTAVRTVRLGPIRRDDILGRLRSVAQSERISLGSGVLEAIAARSQGDLRAALNDLEAIAPLPLGSGQLELLGTRDLASDFAGLTEEVLSRPRYYRSVEVRDRLDAPPDDLLPWVEENVPWFAPDDAHRDAAFSVVATAELFLARARRWRTYGLWSYATELLTGGVGLAVRERPASGPGHAAFPTFLGEMGRSRGSRGVREALTGKLSSRLHLSRAKSRAVALPFLEALFSRAGRGRRGGSTLLLARALVAELSLTPEEIGWLLRSEPESPLVRELVASEPRADGPELPEVASAPPSGRAEKEASSPTSRPAVQRRLGE